MPTGTWAITDGDANRASETVGGLTTFFLVDDRNPAGYAQVLEEEKSTGLSVQYNYGLALISQEQATGAIRYYGYDRHGSVRFLLGLSGLMRNTYVYDAYGNLISADSIGPVVPNNYLYCAQQYDPNLNLYLNRARYYQPNTGRFWTADTDEGDQEDPLSLHKYFYCEANPINGVDPSGHDGDDISTLAAGALGATVDGLVNAAVVGTETVAEGTVVTAEATEATAAAEATALGTESATGATTEAEVAAAQAEADAEGALTYDEIQKEGVTITEGMTKSQFNKLLKSIQKNGIQDKVIKLVKIDGDN
jgi:RHS repeat-associated protein